MTTNIDVDLLGDDVLLGIRTYLGQTYIAIERNNGTYKVLIFETKRSFAAWRRTRERQLIDAQNADVIDVTQKSAQE